MYYICSGCGRPGVMESMPIAEAIGEVRSVLQSIVQHDIGKTIVVIYSLLRISRA